MLATGMRGVDVSDPPKDGPGDVDDGDASTTDCNGRLRLAGFPIPPTTPSTPPMWPFFPFLCIGAAAKCSAGKGLALAVVEVLPRCGGSTTVRHVFWRWRRWGAVEPSSLLS